MQFSRANIPKFFTFFSHVQLLQLLQVYILFAQIFSEQCNFRLNQNINQQILLFISSGLILYLSQHYLIKRYLLIIKGNTKIFIFSLFGLALFLLLYFATYFGFDDYGVYAFLPSVAITSQVIKNWQNKEETMKIDYFYYLIILAMPSIQIVYWFIFPSIMFYHSYNVTLFNVVSTLILGIILTLQLSCPHKTIQYILFKKPIKMTSQASTNTPRNTLVSNQIEISLDNNQILNDFVQYQQQPSTLLFRNRLRQFRNNQIIEDERYNLRNQFYQAINLQQIRNQQLPFLELQRQSQIRNLVSYFVNDSEMSIHHHDNDQIPQCAICQQPINVFVSNRLFIMNCQDQDQAISQDSFDELMADKDFSVKTNCEHFFHSRCIIKWMNQKIDCPLCRNRLENFEKVQFKDNQN